MSTFKAKRKQKIEDNKITEDQLEIAVINIRGRIGYEYESEDHKFYIDFADIKQLIACLQEQLVRYENKNT